MSDTISKERTTINCALDAIEAYAAKSSHENSVLMAAKSRAMLYGYHYRWFQEMGDIKVLKVERPIITDLWNPETQARSRSYQMAGMLDVLFQQVSTGKEFLLDHKSCSEEIGPDADYCRQLTINPQATHYFLLNGLSDGRKPDGAIWDLLRKPLTKPKELSKAEQATVLGSGFYFGFSISQESLDYLRETKRESIEMYECRLMDDCTQVRPDWFFYRHPVPRMEPQIADYADDLWQISKDMLAAKKLKRLPKSAHACMLYGSACKFLGICSGKDTPDSPKWQQKPVRHVELGEHGDIDAITPSRIASFLTCKVKHRYEYEYGGNGIERYDADEKEALYFGSMLHAGLEAWWKSFIQGESNGNSESANDTETTATSGTAPGEAPGTDEPGDTALDSKASHAG